MLMAQGGTRAATNTLAMLLQALNGHSIKAEEVTKAQEMFQALHEARVDASKHPLSELVRRALTAIHSMFVHPVQLQASRTFCEGRSTARMLHLGRNKLKQASVTITLQK